MVFRGAPRRNSASVERALEEWPKFEASGQRLGSPACVHPDNEWMQIFKESAEQRVLRVVFVCMHSYCGPCVEARPLFARCKDVSSENFENIATGYRTYQNNRGEVCPQAVKAAKATGAPVPPQPQTPELRCHDCPCASSAPISPPSSRLPNFDAAASKFGISDPDAKTHASFHGPLAFLENSLLEVWYHLSTRDCVLFLVCLCWSRGL